MSTVNSLYPTADQSPADQLHTLQQALQQLANTVNQNATAPAVVSHVPSSTLTDQSSTTGNATYQSQQINSKGGLVSINGSISASGSGYVGLSIDGNTVLKVPTSSGMINWSQVLPKGSHTLNIIYGASSGTVTINPSGFSSAFSVNETPSNVQEIG